MYKNKILLTVGMIIFLDNIGGGIIMPILPALFMNNKVGITLHSTLEVKSFYFGLSYLLFPIMAIFSNPYLGYLSDYKGRKFMLTIGILGFIVTNLITIFSIIKHNLWLFLLTRLMLGFFSGSYTAASAALMDLSDNEFNKINNIKFITLISILGLIVSPVFSILIPVKYTTATLTIPFVIVFILSLVNLLLVVLFFPDNHSVHNKSPQPKILNMLLTSFLFIYNTPNIFKTSMIFFIFQLGYSFYFQIIALNLQQMHNFSISETGIFFFVMGLCYICGMYIIHPMSNRYFKNDLAIKISVIISALAIIILYFNEQLKFLWVLNIVFFSVSPVASINLFKQFVATDKDNQGLVMGSIGQISALSLIFSALIISLHGFFNKSYLLITSIMMIIVFIMKTFYPNNE